MPAYTLIDGTAGPATAISDARIVKVQVWCSETSSTAGNALQVDTAAVLPSGVPKAYKKCAADDALSGGLISATTFTGGPSTGTLIEAYARGHLTGTSHGITDSGSGISLGDPVAAANGGGIKTAAAANAGKRIIGFCTKAFTASGTDGEIELYPQDITVTA